MISIRQAAKMGVERLRLPHWANPTDHLKIDIVRGAPGPWTHLYSDSNEMIGGRNPVDILATEMDYDAEVYEEYTPPSTGPRSPNE